MTKPQTIPKDSMGERLRTVTLRVTRGVHPIRILRRLVQILSLILLNGALITLITGIPIFSPLTNIWIVAQGLGFLNLAAAWVHSYVLVIPVLQTYSSPYTIVGGVFGLLQRRITSGAFPFLELGVVLITAVSIGKGFCGWVCPFGTVQDVVSKIPMKRPKVSPSFNKELSEIKYYLLGAIMVIVIWVGIAEIQGVSEALRNALGALSEAPYNALNPQTTLDTLLWWMLIEGTLPTLDSIGLLLTFSPFFWVRIVLLAVSLIFALVIPRSFCRYFCPLGALMGVFSKYSLFTFSRKPVRCAKVRTCEIECPMGIRILSDNYEKINNRDCINCGKCYAVCPHHAIVPRVL
ncbi:MAG: 4Fe-4S binding protein [Candidatus Ranarchaeia archaeon]